MAIELTKVLVCGIALVLSLVVPHTLHMICNKDNGCSLVNIFSLNPYKYVCFQMETMMFVQVWLFYQGLLSIIPIGETILGPQCVGGFSVLHRINGSFMLISSLLTFGAVSYLNIISFASYHNEFLSLITGLFLSALILSYLILKYSEEAEGNLSESNGVFYDYVFGRLRSPKLFGFIQVKVTAFKAGFMTWGLLNLIHVHHSWDHSGGKNYILFIVASLQSCYIADHLIHEESALHTATLSNEKIGFVAIIAMFLHCPVTSSLQVNFLSHHVVIKSNVEIALYLLLFCFGYYMYRASVNEKFQFRKDPETAKLKGAVCIRTDKGKDLLVSGWWGMLRHPNYTGDILMNISWALLCGFTHVYPWIWVIGLMLLLIMMAKNDDSACLKKYGKYWEEYKKRVPYVMIPYVF